MGVRPRDRVASRTFLSAPSMLEAANGNSPQRVLTCPDRRADINGFPRSCSGTGAGVPGASWRGAARRERHRQRPLIITQPPTATRLVLRSGQRRDRRSARRYLSGAISIGSAKAGRAADAGIRTRAQKTVASLCATQGRHAAQRKGGRGAGPQPQEEIDIGLPRAHEGLQGARRATPAAAAAVRRARAGREPHGVMTGAGAPRAGSPLDVSSQALPSDRARLAQHLATSPRCCPPEDIVGYSSSITRAGTPREPGKARGPRPRDPRCEDRADVVVGVAEQRPERERVLARFAHLAGRAAWSSSSPRRAASPRSECVVAETER